MGKFSIYFLTYLIGIILQFAFSKYFAFFGVFPNILLLGLLFIGLRRGSTSGEVMGFFWGISWDVLSVDIFASHALLFTIIGYISGKLSRKLDESKIATQMIIAGFASIVFWIGMDLIRMIFGENSTGIRLDYITLLQVPYNMILSPVIFVLGKYVAYLLSRKDKSEIFY